MFCRASLSLSCNWTFRNWNLQPYSRFDHHWTIVEQSSNIQKKPYFDKSYSKTGGQYLGYSAQDGVSFESQLMRNRSSGLTSPPRVVETKTLQTKYSLFGSCHFLMFERTMSFNANTQFFCTHGRTCHSEGAGD